jgi:uncharacterized protein with HEPN domain
MLECIEKCWIYSKDYDNPHDFVWENDQRDLNATISLFIAIGEESKKIDESLKNDIEIKIKWKNIAGIRDKISHNYRGVNEDVLWSIIHSDLYDVKNALIEMITLLNPPKEALNEFLDSIYYKHLQYLRNIPTSDELLSRIEDIKNNKVQTLSREELFHIDIT